MAKPKYTIADFNREYPDADACLETVLGMVYPDGILCRKCGIVRPHSKLTGRKAYSCNYCGTHVYPLAGTIFEKSTTPLKSWFYAMYLMSTTRCGISAKQLERELDVTYKTAWRMFNQIRKLMEEDGGPLSGEGLGGRVNKTRHGRYGQYAPLGNRTPIRAGAYTSVPSTVRIWYVRQWLSLGEKMKKARHRGSPRSEPFSFLI